jgi:hypothetical protein
MKAFLKACSYHRCVWDNCRNLVILFILKSLQKGRNECDLHASEGCRGNTLGVDLHRYAYLCSVVKAG